MTKTYHFKNIRTLLTDGFKDQELRAICFDNSDFRPVYNQLSEGTSKDWIVHQLLEYAEQRELIEFLLDEAKKGNPYKYEKYEPYFTIIRLM